MEFVGEIIDLPERVAEPLVKMKLLKPYGGRMTKENKDFAKLVKAEIEHDAGKMFYVKQGDRVVDRLPKKKAQKLADELNNSI